MITRHRSQSLPDSHVNWHKPVWSASICESAFLHRRLSLSSFLQRYNSSISRKSTNSHLSSCDSFFYFQVSHQNRKKKKKLQGKISLVTFSPPWWSHSRLNRLAFCFVFVTLSVCSSSSSNAQVPSVTWADDSSAIIDISMATFPLRSFCETMLSVTK